MLLIEWNNNKQSVDDSAYDGRRGRGGRREGEGGEREERRRERGVKHTRGGIGGRSLIRRQL